MGALAKKKKADLSGCKAEAEAAAKSSEIAKEKLANVEARQVKLAKLVTDENGVKKALKDAAENKDEEEKKLKHEANDEAEKKEEALFAAAQEKQAKTAKAEAAAEGQFSKAKHKAAAQAKKVKDEKAEYTEKKKKAEDEEVEQKNEEAEKVIKTKADASKGTDEIQVDNSTSFLAGDRISVDGEPCTVADTTPPTGIKLKDGLQQDH